MQTVKQPDSICVGVLLAGAAVAAACLMVCSRVEAQPPEAGRPDTIPFDTRYSEAIRELADRGVIQGYPDGYAYPIEMMTRYEFAAAWVRLLEILGWPIEQGRLPPDLVTDVPSGHWARAAVVTLASSGLLSASPFGDVRPMHWAAPAVQAVGPDAHRPDLAFRGDEPLLRRDYAEMAYRTACNLGSPGTEWSRTELQHIGAIEFVTRTRILIGLPRPDLVTAPPELRLWASMRRGDFFLASVRLLKWAKQ